MRQKIQALKPRDINRTYGGNKEKLHWSYYDTLVLNGTKRTHRLFTEGLGGSKTLAYTNMPTSGSIPQMQDYEVKEMKIFYIGLHGKKTEEDLWYCYQMLGDSTLQIKPAGKDSLLTMNLLEVFGITWAVVLEPSVAGNNIPMAGPKYTGVIPINISLFLDRLVNFEILVEHHGPIGNTMDNDRILVSLGGKLDRGS